MLLAYNGGFKRHSKVFVQILNRSKGSVSHWVTVSNVNCLHDKKMVYHSACDDNNVLKVKFVDIQMHRNSNN